MANFAPNKRSYNVIPATPTGALGAFFSDATWTYNYDCNVGMG
jgi:hypothetical protein